MPSKNPKSLIAWPESVFEKLEAEARERKLTVQSLVREIVAAHFAVEAPVLTRGRSGETWGNAIPQDKPNAKSNVTMKSAKK